MMKKTIAATIGALAMTAALDASAYTYTWNVNGVGASATNGQVVGLGPGGTGTQYHHWVDGMAPGQTWSVLGSDHAMFDPMRPGNGDASAYGVGAQSWCQAAGPGGCLNPDALAFNPDAPNSEGWQHTSQHILFSLTQATDVTITLSNAPAFAGGHTFNTNTGTLAGNLIPGMTLFSGKSTTGLNYNNHVWENMPTDAQPAPLHWSNITYLAHDANTANASSITDVYHLAAGDYTLYIGGNQANNTGGKNFALSIAAAPVPVPAAVWLFGSALAGMGIIGRRKDKAAA